MSTPKTTAELQQLAKEAQLHADRLAAKYGADSIQAQRADDRAVHLIGKAVAALYQTTNKA